MPVPRRLAVLSALLLLMSLPGVRRVWAGDDPTPAFLPHTPQRWLVVAPVDDRSRRPFNPDAVFSRRMLDPESAPPRAGGDVEGERGKTETWKTQAADAEGHVKGDIAWAYTSVTAPKSMIVMAWLDSGATLFVNGTPYAGAIYGDRFEVPVRLRKGANDVYVRGVRGAFRLTFSKPPAPLFVAPFRQTKPDVVAGEALEAIAGVLLVNATDRVVAPPACQVVGNAWLAPATSPTTLPLAPLAMVQIRLPLRTKKGQHAPTKAGPVEVALKVGGQPATVTFQVRPRSEAVIRTFVSSIDDSVQRFGMRAPLPQPAGTTSKDTPPAGLVLSLHGAGVNPRGQVNAYAPKADFWLVVPTNRDRFGFDWQDWGREDAYEVLAEGLRISGVARNRVYLTGHSMGGHGTWHLGANDPDGFAAIAPSAGWISFDTYPAPRRKGALTDIWQAADAPSRTRRLLGNLRQLPTYILHGTKDDNVPVAQAREMQKLLTEAGTPPQVHYEEGAGHWWDGHPEPGAQCVDWPGFYDMFRKQVIPPAPRSIEFTSADLSVDARHYWIEILQAIRYGEPCSVEASWDPKKRAYEVHPQNVATLKIHYPGSRARVQIEESTTTFDKDQETATTEVWARKHAGRWLVTPAPRSPATKAPRAGGPFKRVFGRRFVLVYGTTGSEEEQRALLEQARFDGQRWMYRANGQSVLLSDRAWQQEGARLDLAERNTVVYGNRDTNAAFTPLARGAPVTRGACYHSGLRRGDNIGACYVGPGPRPGTLVGFCASTGVLGARLGFTLSLFISGAGWPDFVFFDEDILTEGDGGVLEAGWYDQRWAIQKGSYVRDD